MLLFAFIVFCISVVGIGGLFALKYREIKQGVVVAESFRLSADQRAHQLKDLLNAAQVDIARVPPEAVRIMRFLVHEAALGFAAFARMIETQSHRLADVVSHKHHFERRETRSEFLKKVAEHKNGNGGEDLRK
jgi:hypothetical protein